MKAAISIHRLVRSIVLDPEDRISQRYVQRTRRVEFEIDLMDRGLHLLDPVLQLHQVVRLGRHEVVVLEFHAMDVVMVGHRFRETEGVQGPVWTLGLRRLLHDRVEIQAHDGDTIQLRLGGIPAARSREAAAADVAIPAANCLLVIKSTPFKVFGPGPGHAPWPGPSLSNRSHYCMEQT